MFVAIEGIDEAVETITGAVERFRDLSPVLEVAAIDTQTLIDDSFENASAPDGTPWLGHSPTTTAIRARRGRSGKVLQNTTRLRRSIAVTSDKRSFRFGTNVEYAGPLQLGATIKVFGRGKPRALVARPFLPVVGSNNRYELMTTGSAASHWSRIRDMVKRYVVTGQL